jgi:hypothetical protein
VQRLYLRVQRAVELAFVDANQVKRAVVHTILCAIKQMIEPPTFSSAMPSKKSEPLSGPSAVQFLHWSILLEMLNPD